MNTETLKSLYQRDNWRLLLNELFGSNFKAFSRVEDLPVENQTAKSAVQLGEITLASGDVLAVYEVELQDHVQVERNKVAIRNLLRTHWNKYDGAFIASFKTNENVWRFSFVSETRQYDDEGNYGKVATAAKRFTYVLGQGESIRTATERFNILAATGKNTTLEDIKGAFNVEKMSKDFFDNYKKQYELFCEYMLSKPSIRQAIFNGDEKAIRDFNKKLLGRIVFLYFIQKKGWLGVPLHGEWGDGDTNFLTNLFKKYEHPELFYSSILTVLFFDTLNKKRENDIVELIKSEKCKIPFLNGGLFEEDNTKHREIIFPKEQFRNLFIFFNQYNFTIYEDDPNDHTVAVDPEMLGHIFENLLEDNKDKGAFYTPKEIVHYMCQESLIEYLCTTLQIEDEAKEREAITRLIKTKEIDDILKPEIQNINKALDRVKICDPAIGSGAFPMGLLHEIFAVKLTLYIFENNTSEGFDAAAVKLNIIQNSIYGVDIEPGAVDIARLRFWLSLIVDEPTPKALPNLDYKIVVGNSLVSKLDDDIINIDWSLNDTSHGLFATDLAKEKSYLLEKIGHKQKLFFSSDCDKKKLSIDIRNLKIDLLINQLNLMNQKQNIPTKPSPENYLNKPKAKFTEDTAKYLQCLGRKDKIKKLETLKTKADETLHFFDWKLDFPEIMNENVAGTVGFDIVIANPPYIKEYTYRDAFDGFRSSPYYQGKMDIWYGFACMMLDLLKPKGIECFIAQNNWITSAGASILRNKILKDSQILLFTDFGNFKVFNSAGIQTMVYLLKNQTDNAFYQTRYTLLTNDSLTMNEIPTLLNFDLHSEYAQKYIYNFKSLDFWDKSISFNVSSIGAILDKIESKSNFKLTEKEVIQGIVGAPDEAFIIEKDKLRLFNKEEKQYIKPYYTNASGSSDLFIIYLSDKNFYGKKLSHYPNLLEHFKPFKKELTVAKVKYKTPSKPYFYLHRERDETFFKKGDKIICQIRSAKPNFLFTIDEYYVSRAANIIKSSRIDLKYLSLLLNSNLTYFYYKNRGASQGNILKFDKGPLLEIPIRKSKNITKFNLLFHEIKSVEKNDSNMSIKLNEINTLVYKLYDLTYDEVMVVDPDFGLSEEEYAAIIID